MNLRPRPPRFSGTLVALVLTAGAVAASAAADWSNWRGPSFNGSATNPSLPRKIDAAQVLWKTPLPGKGCSTPIVWQQRIYLTAPVGGKDALLAFDWAGKPVWQAVFGPEEKGKHRYGSGSNPSAVTDGKRIFVAFKSGRFAAVDLSGKILWQHDLVEQYGPVKMFFDFGSSPVLTARDVVMARMHEGESWLAAYDQATGKLRWKTARNYKTPKEVDQSYNTPLVLQQDGREVILTWGAQHLTAHDAADGRLLWSCGGFNPEESAMWPAVASPVVVDGLAVICFGRADRGIPRLHGIKLGGKGDVTATNRVWVRDDVGAFVPTPAVYQGRVYVLGDKGKVDCLESATGKTLWSGQFSPNKANFYTSPLVANGLLYAAREDGTVVVARVENAFEIVSESKFADNVVASIVPAGDRLLIRGAAQLYCVAAQ